jgi:hypothetical protein
VWGLVDGYIKTDFPDVRALSVVENNGRVSQVAVFSSYFISAQY